VKTKKLILVGDSAFAEIAYEYFDVDSEYDVVAFSVERAFMNRDRLCGLPILPFEELETHLSPEEHHVFVAVVYTQLNRLRTRLMSAAKLKGYQLASFVSPRAFVWRNVEIGEHCFIFEDNTIQPFVKIGSNVVLWSGNHVGHHSVIRDNCFLSSHVVISGYCDIGENSFLGVNSTVANTVVIGRDNWINPGVSIMNDTEPDAFYKSADVEPAKVGAKRFFRVRE
jgi:sugar O-acyltransferase (sialic acid O-acetyltransferase NeuD family)